ncbi:tRNA methyl transferase-domain-containing protein [Naematelia encephala]|uniref:tRNA-5-taurinomethyluridine 2-sulfurtransferase n=1 Tax=Naematelia encephala TaxID=71784 RepID=A0A1Y2AW78_9TREE|nr:tRNA methyl transferase-domain-containing protein [Naematelia encephala]
MTFRTAHRLVPRLQRASRTCPVVSPPPCMAIRRAHAFTPVELKQLLPTMEDIGLQRGDQVTMAMSGGVDSSVSLRILSEMPIDLNVVYMKNWDPLLSENQPEEPETLDFNYGSIGDSPSHKKNASPCSWEKDWNDVRAVAKHVGIPDDRVKLLDFTKEYWGQVFEPSLRSWEAGLTPNPDVDCNRYIKFGALLRHIPRGKRSFLATGHYARIKRAPHAIRLCRAKDMTKDQTYYLSSITEEQLRRAIFPLGSISKVWVRRLAEYYALPTADRDESMGLCFVGERGNFGEFISQYTTPPETQGYLVNEEGEQLAQHKGLWTYTIGQGAKIANQLQPFYVAKKGIGESGQDILVVPGSDHPKLMCTRLHTRNFHWIHNKVPNAIVPGGEKKAYLQVRHRQDPISVIVSHDWNGRGLQVEFPEPVYGVAPGQVATLWYNLWCLGSGVIDKTITADELPAKSFAKRRHDENELRKARRAEKILEEERKKQKQIAANKRASEVWKDLEAGKIQVRDEVAKLPPPSNWTEEWDAPPGSVKASLRAKFRAEREAMEESKTTAGFGLRDGSKKDLSWKKREPVKQQGYQNRSWGAMPRQGPVSKGVGFGLKARVDRD